MGRVGDGGNGGAEANAAQRCWMLDIEAGRVSIYYHQPHFIRIKQQLKGLEDGGESQVLIDSEGRVTSQQDVTLGRRSEAGKLSWHPLDLHRICWDLPSARWEGLGCASDVLITALDFRVWRESEKQGVGVLE